MTPPRIITICKSCLTGRAVWLYRGTSREGARKAYYRACQKELERVRQIMERLQRRKANIMRVLGECTALLPLDVSLTREQREAVKQLHTMIKQGAEPDMAFYEHIMEERRRREEDRRLRHKMKEQKNRNEL